MIDSPATTVGNLLQELGVAPGQTPVVERQGRRIQITYTQQRRNQPATIRLTVDVDVAPAGAAGRKWLAARPLVVMRRETGRDRLGKRLNLNREVQTGDSLFDGEVYVESDASDADVQAVLADARAREHVRALVADRAAVTLDGAGLAASFPFARTFGREAFEQAASHLVGAAAALPLFGPSPAPARRSMAGIVAVMALWPAALVFAAIMGGGHQPVRTMPWLLAVGAGLIVWALALGLVAPLVRGRSDGLRRFSLLALLLVFPLPMVTTTLLFWANGALDASPPVEHESKIERVWFTQTKNGHRTYYAAVDDWLGQGGQLKLRISAQESGRAHPGDGIVVTTSAGRLGWEWLRGYRFPSRW